MVVSTNDYIYVLATKSKEFGEDNNRIRQEVQTMMNQKGIKLNTKIFEDAALMINDINESKSQSISIDSSKHEAITKAILGSSM